MRSSFQFMSTVALLVFAPADEPRLERLGEFDAPNRQEISGIVASRRRDDVFWIHNDSGNLPDLFAIDRTGRRIATFRVGAINIDWEDIAADAHGRLYIGDIGNNRSRLPIRAIHALDEPNADAPKDQPLPIISSTFYRFAAERFDAEALWIDADKAFLVEKRLDAREPSIYSILLKNNDLQHPTTPSKVGVLAGFIEPVTGADLSVDRRWLAVCGTTAARFYERNEDDGWRLRTTVRFNSVGGGSIEAIAWDGRDAILVNEPGSIFRIREPIPPKATDR